MNVAYPESPIDDMWRKAVNEREEQRRRRHEGREQERLQIVLEDTHSRVTIHVHVEGAAVRQFEMATLQQAPITLQLGRVIDSYAEPDGSSGDFAISFERLEIPSMVIDAVQVDPASLTSKEPDPEPRKSRYDLIKKAE